MTRDEAVAEIQEGLKFRQDQADRAVRRLARVQHILEMGRELPWFLIETLEVPLAPVPPERVIEIELDPARFIREIDQGRPLFYRVNSGGNFSGPLFPRKVQLSEGQVSSSGGSPNSYSLLGYKLRFFPGFSGNATLSLDYYAKDTFPGTGDETNKWLTHAPYVLIGNAGVSLAQTLSNKSAESEFKELAGAATKALQDENILREIANRQILVGRRA